MRTFTLYLAACLSAAVLFTGCSKDNDDNSQPSNSGGGLLNTGGDGGGNGGGGGGGGNQTPVQLLCDKNYKLTASTISPAFQGTTNYFSLLEACNTDDILRFAQAGTLTLDEGASMCDPSGQQTHNGNWTFTNNNQVLNLTIGGSSLTWNVMTMDGNTLKVNWQGTDQQGTTYTLTDTWTRQ